MRIHSIVYGITAMACVGLSTVADAAPMFLEVGTHWSDSLTLGRLSVRPTVMGAGKETAHAGEQRLDTLYRGDSLLDKAFVYVPKSCVGTRRCPLLVVLHGSGMSGLDMIHYAKNTIQDFADSNGVILLGPTSHSSDGGWGNSRDAKNVDVPRIDAALRQVIQHYAIDPARIALLGASAGAGSSIDFGYTNGDVFSRVLAFSGFRPFYAEHEVDPFQPHGTPLFYIAIPKGEAAMINMSALVAHLRQAKYSVSYDEDDYGHMSVKRTVSALAWLAKSWH